MPEIAIHLLALLFLVAILSGFVDAIAGGGGMLTIPAMLLAGLPPLQVLGTNKLQGLFGSGAASWAYARHGHVDPRKQWPMVATAAIGATGGALIATSVPTDWLQFALPLLLVVIAVYFALKPSAEDVDRHGRLTPFVFGATLVPTVGLYDGIFGPGTGSFLMLGFVALAGYSLLKATAHTKFINFGSNAGAFAVFVAHGAVLWKVGFVMGVGQVIGAQLGSRFAMSKGAGVIKPLLVTVSLALAVRLLADPTHPLREWISQP